ncbi:hypothetical protein WJX72_004418 [[Myrmecia] bisecta]|uniref:Centriolar satellite-associated tubulin polyglutamylase complex regulator 1 n=1 Tax=[Myrmecia] bisecta TaxID=41462 RepID=A0AAW1PXP9_9CHLO
MAEPSDQNDLGQRQSSHFSAGPSDSTEQQEQPSTSTGNSTSSAAPSVEEYLQKHHLGVYISDMVGLLLQGSTDVADPVIYAADYLTAVVAGHHVVGRSFTYIAATPHNRRTFLAVAKRTLAHVHRIGELSLEDFHSLLQLLCPDIPLRVVKSAFKAALGVWPQASTQGSTRLAFDRLLRCMEVTFLYERYLLDLRNHAFSGRSHLAKPAGSVREAAALVEASVTRSGWCAAPDVVIQDALQEACKAAASPSIHFDALVRALCASERMRQHVQLENAASIIAARANAAQIADFDYLP